MVTKKTITFNWVNPDEAALAVAEEIKNGFTIVNARMDQSDMTIGGRGRGPEFTVELERRPAK